MSRASAPSSSASSARSRSGRTRSSRMRLGAGVGGRVEVRAAREQEAVEGVQRLLDSFRARRHEQRPPPAASIART